MRRIRSSLGHGPLKFFVEGRTTAGRGDGEVGEEWCSLDFEGLVGGGGSSLEATAIGSKRGHAFLFGMTIQHDIPKM